MEALGPQLRDLPDAHVRSWVWADEARAGIAEIGHEIRSLEGRL